MEEQPSASIVEYFAELTDPRVERTKRHLLLDIFVIALCAVICGAEGWVDLEAYGKAKEKWLRQFLALPHGIPAHDMRGYWRDSTRRNCSGVFYAGCTLSVL